MDFERVNVFLKIDELSFFISKICFSIVFGLLVRNFS